MARPRKRRSDVLDDEAEDSSSSPQPPSRRRQPRPRSASSPQRPPQRQQSASEDEDDDDDEEGDSAPDADIRGSPFATQTTTQPNPDRPLNSSVKKLIRLALATEYSRQPLRRADISAKVLQDADSTSTSTSGPAGRSTFKHCFAAAQAILRETFGMELVELPSREKTSLKDRRAKATQTQQTRGAVADGETQAETQTAGGKAAAGSKSWILTSVLPATYRTSMTRTATRGATNSTISNNTTQQPLLLPSAPTSSSTSESTYTALYTFILSLIYLNANSLPTTKLDRYLGRVNLETYSPLEGLSVERLMARMMREGYVEKRKEGGPGEEEVYWVVGPRGRVEVGERGVVGLVRGVYGVSGEEAGAAADDNEEEDEGGDEQEAGSRQAGRTTNGVRRKTGVKVDKDDLDSRLMRSLALKSLDFDDGARSGGGGAVNGANNAINGADDMEVDGAQQPPPRRGRTRRARNDDDDDEDDD